jgi:hypothetical protein
MSFMPFEGGEPIPGYQLLNRLGTGGFGEVWKVTAPGGLAKAIKIVYGHMNEARADQELRALSRIKEVRHPFLLSLERFEILDGQLFIVTELADSSLFERYQACRASGQRGISRDELLGYFRDAADALDYMASHYGLQHLDVKPQNLLLVGGRIKVADFGLVKDLQGTSVTATGGVTPIYAPPEAFDGRISRFSDQYSLAVVYQEMLTGVRPFPGTTAYQLAAQHTTSPPMLDPLPFQDRAVIGRALAKVPDQRFTCCREMVDHLVHGLAAPVAAPPTREAPPSTRVSATPAPGSAAAQAEILNVDTDVAVTAFSPAEVRLPTPSDKVRLTPPQTTPVRPVLFLGVGGLAGRVLRRLRRRLHKRFGSLAAVPVFHMLLLDVDRAALQQARDGDPGEALTAEETLSVPLYRPEHYRDRSRELLRWLDRRWLYNIPRSLQTEGLRPLGRLALVDHAAELLARLREVLEQIASAESKEATARATGLTVSPDPPTVFLVASLSGSTSGGMVNDLAYATRQALGELEAPSESVRGLLLYAARPNTTDSDVARATAYATLAELHHFSRPDAVYPGSPADGLAAAAPGVAPFSDCYVVHLGDNLEDPEADAAANSVAEYLYLNAATPGGQQLEQQRAGSRGHPGTGEANPLRTFGLVTIGFPRQRLADATAALVCRQLVLRWLGESERTTSPRSQIGTTPPPCMAELDAEALAGQLHSAARAHWRLDPDAQFRQLLADVPMSSAPGEWIAELLEKVDRLVGAGRDRLDPNRAPGSAFEAAVRKQAEETGARLGREMEAWLVGMVEDPRKRIKAADRSARWLVQQLKSATEIGRTQWDQVHTHRIAARERLQAGDLASRVPVSLRWLGIGRRQSGADQDQAVVSYCWLRLLEVALENAVGVLSAVSGQIANFNVNLALCRQRLGRLVDSFTASAEEAEPAPPALAGEQIELFPGGAKTVAQAADVLQSRLSSEATRQIDETFQMEVLNPQGGIWRMTGGDQDASMALAESLRAHVQAEVLTELAETDAAKLFLEAHSDPAEALRKYYRAAIPRLEPPAGWQHLVLAAPKSAAGAALADLVARTLPTLPLTEVRSQEELVICVEAAHVSWTKAAAAITGGEPAYAEAAQRIMTRTDVAWTPLEPLPAAPAPAPEP